MKPNTVTALVLICLLPMALLLGGCPLFDDSVKKAQEVAELRQTEFEEARAKFEAAKNDVEVLIAQFQDAQASGDQTLIQTTGDTLARALAKLETYEDAYKAAGGLLDSAITDFKNAQGASDYLGTIMAWIAGLFGLGGVGVQQLRVRTRDEALGGTTNALEKVKSALSTGEAWQRAKLNMQASLSTSALKVIDKARP